MPAKWRLILAPIRWHLLAIVFGYSAAFTALLSLLGLHSPGLLMAAFALLLVIYVLQTWRALHAIDKLDQLAISRPQLAEGRWRAANQLCNGPFEMIWWNERERRLTWTAWIADRIIHWLICVALIVPIVFALVGYMNGASTMSAQGLEALIPSGVASFLAAGAVSIGFEAFDRIRVRRR